MVLAWVVAMVVALLMPAGAEKDGGWTVLFDGETLNGWEKHGGKAVYAVEDGAIVGHCA